MIEIVRYTPEKLAEWNAFVEKSKNGTFLFDRNYMDYHADRFSDFSLMIYYKSSLYMLLPANRRDNTLYSHQGLTYGGLVMTSQCKTAVVRDALLVLNDFLRSQGIRRVVYKHVPWIYATIPAEEDLFGVVNACHARLLSRDVAAVVMLDQRLPFSTLRKRCKRKAERSGVVISESDDLPTYWNLLEENLRDRFSTRPVHSLQEILLLKSRFPQHIRLFVATLGNEMIGGTLMYMDSQTAKTQYISANETGKRLGALDLLFGHLLERCDAEGLRYFDFGTSNAVGSDDLNDSLIFQKEGFGGRAVCYDTYEWEV